MRSPILFARTDKQCRRSIGEHDELLNSTAGVRSLSYLDLNATPPFNCAHDHFGFRDRLSQPVMKGSERSRRLVRVTPSSPVSSSWATPMRMDRVPHLPKPEALSRNGSYLAYRGSRSMSDGFGTTFARRSDSQEAEELLAAKFMGRWRSGAPWCWRPSGTIPSGCRSDAQQRFRLQAQWIRSAMPARWGRTRVGSIHATPGTT